MHKRSTSYPVNLAAYPSENIPKKPVTSIGEYQLLHTLGTGSTGKVKLALHKNGTHFACKIVKRPVSDGKTYTMTYYTIQDEPIERPVTKATMDDIRIRREIQLSFILNHPAIVPLREAIVTDTHYYLFFDYIEGAQLLDFIISHGKIKEKYARNFFKQIVSTVEYCHAHSIVHRDLKIENILIDRKGKIKLIDFGLANVYSPSALLSTFCGSLYFAAPELLSAKKYVGPEVDIWSLGVILYVLVYGRVPFDDSSLPALHAKIKKARLDYPDTISLECMDLLKKIFVVDPAERIDLEGIKSHPWLEGSLTAFIPERPALKGLNDVVIQHMGGVNLGTSQEIKDKLAYWLIYNQPPIESSDETNPNYVAYNSRDLVRSKRIKGPSFPLINIYYLVQEYLDHLKISPSTSIQEWTPPSSQLSTPIATPRISPLKLSWDLKESSPTEDFSNKSFQEFTKVMHKKSTGTQARLKQLLPGTIPESTAEFDGHEPLAYFGSNLTDLPKGEDEVTQPLSVNYITTMWDSLSQRPSLRSKSLPRPAKNTGFIEDQVKPASFGEMFSIAYSTFQPPPVIAARLRKALAAVSEKHMIEYEETKGSIRITFPEACPTPPPKDSDMYSSFKRLFYKPSSLSITISILKIAHAYGLRFTNSKKHKELVQDILSNL